MTFQVLPEDEYPPTYWSDLDDEDEEYGGAVPCCICSCSIGDEVEFGAANYWGDGRPICANCLEAPVLENALEGEQTP
ncbi:MAG: hypothetical protein KGL39_51450 [Patescibacteria group bacterium]|nr:hypothetical protein [Patescibacteria group bacterium]